jgi:hypothetical protein
MPRGFSKKPKKPRVMHSRNYPIIEVNHNGGAYFLYKRKKIKVGLKTIQRIAKRIKRVVSYAKAQGRVK